MQMEELKERYKLLPIWARLVACALLGVAPAAYVYMDESEQLDQQLAEANNQEQAARQKFETARNQKANIRKLEEQKQFTNEQLFKAKKSLPDSYRIEDVLERAATIAKETGVKLLRFNPGEEAMSHGPAQYVEMAIATELDGRFAQLAAFFDRIVHLESSIFVKKMELTRKEAARRPTAANEGARTPHQEAVAARRDLLVHAKFDLVIYRSMTEQEAETGGLPPSESPGQPGVVPPPTGQEKVDGT